jgi:hypothetical protein
MTLVKRLALLVALALALNVGVPRQAAATGPPFGTCPNFQCCAGFADIGQWGGSVWFWGVGTDPMCGTLYEFYAWAPPDFWVYGYCWAGTNFCNDI